MTGPIQPPSDAELRERYRTAMQDESRVDRHPSEQEWERYACDELDAGERARLADHIVACAACADVFRALSDVRTGAAAFDPDAPPLTALPAPRATGRAWLAAAAALALIAGATVAWRMVTTPRAIPTQVEAPSSTRPVPASPPAGAPVRTLPGWAALPAAPAVSLPASLALVVRGASSDRDAFMTAFGSAITPYRAGRYVEAATALEPVTERFPDVVEAWFYLGASRLLAGRPDDAVMPLRRARGSEVVDADARWFEAIALQRAGRDDEARSALSALCGAPGPNRDRACAAVASDR